MRATFLRMVVLSVLIMSASPAAAAIAATDETAPDLPARVSSASWDMALGRGKTAEAAESYLRSRANPDILPTLILAMRYNGDTRDAALDLFNDLSAAKAENWFDAQLWLEEHDEITPHPSYRMLKLFILSNIDAHFLQFLGGDRSDPEKMKIRLEEIAWGGVEVDGIPSLDDPALVRASLAGYLDAKDEVFGVVINGDARAYPLRIMGWHEMFNDVIGGVPVALAYCTLCGSGILYETKVDRYKEPLRFGSSGFLYRSNKLMFDRHTFSLWNQFTGRPVVGPLVGSGIELKTRPVTITTWADWKRKHPKTKVLSLETGHSRNYASGAVYREYFASPDLMFPARVRQDQVQQKEFVFGIRLPGAKKAWPLRYFGDGKVINDTMGARSITLIGNQATRTVRAYFTNGEKFTKGDNADTLSGPGGSWKIEEDTLSGPDGHTYARAPGGISYWFAWDNYLGEESELFTPQD